MQNSKKTITQIFFAKNYQLCHNILSVSFWYTKWITLKYLFSEFPGGNLRIKRKTLPFGPGLCSALDNHHYLLLSGGVWWRRNAISSYSCPHTSKGGTVLYSGMRISQDSLSSHSQACCRLALDLTASRDPFQDSRYSFSNPNEGRTRWQKIGHFDFVHDRSLWYLPKLDPTLLIKSSYLCTKSS